MHYAPKQQQLLAGSNLIQKLAQVNAYADGTNCFRSKSAHRHQGASAVVISGHPMPNRPATVSTIKNHRNTKLANKLVLCVNQPYPKIPKVKLIRFVQFQHKVLSFLTVGNNPQISDR